MASSRGEPALELAGHVRRLNIRQLKTKLMRTQSFKFPLRTNRLLLTFVMLALVIPLLSVSACQQQSVRALAPLKPPEQQTETRTLPEKSSPNLKLVIDGAIDQVSKTTSYDPSYQGWIIQRRCRLKPASVLTSSSAPFARPALTCSRACMRT